MTAQLNGCLSYALYGTGVNLNSLQLRAYSFHFWCESAFTFAKYRTFLLLKTNKKVQPRLKKYASNALLSTKYLSKLLFLEVLQYCNTLLKKITFPNTGH